MVYTLADAIMRKQETLEELRKREWIRKSPSGSVLHQTDQKRDQWTRRK
jgi:hypothetical protein